MAEEIGVIIEGDREIAIKFDEFPDHLRERLREKIDELTNQLYSSIEAAEPERTGALRRSTQQRTNDTKSGVSGVVRVASDFAKAGALEYGAHGAASVSAHQMMISQVFGRALGAPLAVAVSAYRRQLNIAEHRFLRGPADAMRSEIVEGLRETVSQTIDEEGLS